MNAIIVIGLLIVPFVSSMSEDALAAVPRDLRDGALALGATKLEMVGRVSVPAGLSGITASVLLAFSRSVGETMVVLIAAGSIVQVNLNPLGQMTTLAGYIAKRATGDLPVGSVLFQSLFAVGITLFVITLLLNLLSNKLRARFREVYD
jgi:phosphate transport system permease protein